MTRHELKPPIRRALIDAPETGHNRWHPDLPPALTVDPGDEIVVDCRDGVDGQITPATVDADLATLDFRRGHPMTGPIAVRGAEPGDVLKVEILAIETDGFGSTGIFPGFGLLGDLFTEPYLVTWGLHDGVATSRAARGHPHPGRPLRRRDRRRALARAPGALPGARGGARRRRRLLAPARARSRGAAASSPTRPPRCARSPRARPAATWTSRRRARARPSSCPSTCRARCSRSATCTSRRARGRSAAPRSRPTAASRLRVGVVPGAEARLPPPDARVRVGRAAPGRAAAATS